MVVESVEGFRLSPQQRRFWSLLQEPGGAYRSQCVIAVDGLLDRAGLRRAIEVLPERHEIFRTYFHRVPGRRFPVQAFRDHMAPEWREVDLTDLEPEGLAGRVDDLLEEDGQASPDLAESPPLRTTLARLSDDRHLLLFTASPTCADAWTLGNLVHAAGEAYEAVLADRRLEAEDLRYVQFSEWQNELIEAGPEAEDDEDYWGTRDFSPHRDLRLPFRRETPDSAAPARRMEVGRWPADLVDRIEAIAREQGASCETFFLAAWLVFLGRVLGVREPMLSVHHHGRDDELFHPAMGPFAKWLPLALPLHESFRFREVLTEAESAWSRAREWADLFDWERMEAEDRLPRTVFLAFEYHDWPAEARVNGLSFALLRRHVAVEPFELKLCCERVGSALVAHLEYDSARLPSEDVERWGQSFVHAVRELTQAPGARIGELDLLDPSGRQRLLVDFNAVPGPRPTARTVHELIAEWAARSGGSTAVVVEDGQLSYRELDERSSRLAHRLRALGVGPEVLVPLCVRRTPELVVGILGILKAGGAYVAMEPNHPTERLRHILDEVKGPVVVTEADVAPALPEHGARVLRLDADAAAIAAEPATPLEAGAGPENRAYVIYTSGTSGRPKGIHVEHRQLVGYALAAAERLGVQPGEGFATVTTYAADLGNTAIFTSLLTGGVLHLVSEERSVDPVGLAEYFAKHRVDAMKLVPSHLEALLAAPDPAAVVPRRRVVLGGEALSWALVERLGEVAPECRIYNHYGPTETTVGVCTYEVAGPRPDRRYRSVPLGRPLAGSRLFVVDPAFLPMPEWAIGELLIGGTNLARGYLGQPGMTAERYVPDPFGDRPGARLYRTGDLARHVPGKVVEFLGRTDEQVKFHGFRVELSEVRAALERHPEVRTAVVVLHREGGADVLVAHYVAREPIPAGRLREFLRKHIFEETIPNAFVHLERLPLTRNGKIDYAALPSLEQVRHGLRGDGDLTPPRTPIEEVLAGLWCAVLGLGEVGVHSEFASLGGDSLLATQLVSRIRKAFGVDLPLRALFATPTVAGLAGAVEQARRSGESPDVPAIEPVSRDGELPLSYAQERLWIMHQLEPGSAAYNTPSGLRLAGGLDLPALAWSVAELVRRHEVLRTRFRAIDGRPVQEVTPAGPVPFPLVDLSALGNDVREAEAARLASAEARRPFDLERGPLLRLAALRLAAEDHVLLYVLHHVASDAWSAEIVAREVAALYRAARERLPSPLQELPIQYADYAAWQRRWLDGATARAELDYWRQRLAGAEELELPTDRDRPAAADARSAAHRVLFPPELFRSVRDFGRREGATLFMTLLAAFKALLHRHTGQEDLVVGTDIANRNRAELEGLIGFFVNNLALRTHLGGDPSFRELLARVRDVAFEAYAHQDLPFDRLVSALQPQRVPGRTPIFQTLFVLQNTPGVEAELEGLSVAAFPFEFGLSKFDLALFVRTVGDGCRIEWLYRRQLFAPETLVRLAERYERLLASAMESPETPLSRLGMLSPEEEAREAYDREARRESKRSRLSELTARPVTG